MRSGKEGVPFFIKYKNILLKQNFQNFCRQKRINFFLITETIGCNINDKNTKIDFYFCEIFFGEKYF